MSDYNDPAAEPTPAPNDSGGGLAAEGDAGRSSWQGLPTGVLLGAIAALVGAGAWFGLAYLTEREFAYLALGVGFLVGGGVLLGNGRASVPAGAIAAGLALGGIFLGKLLTVMVLTGGIIDEAAADELAIEPEAARQIVIDDRLFYLAAASEDGDDSPEGARAVEEVNAMDDAAVRAAARRVMLENVIAARAAEADGTPIDDPSVTPEAVMAYYDAARREVEPLDDAAVEGRLDAEVRGLYADEADSVAIVKESLGLFDLLFAAAAVFMAFTIAGRAKT